VTVLVGVRCSDGVVIGADSIATSSMGHVPLIHLPSDPKIKIFRDSVIVATTGPIGFAQRLCHHVEAAMTGNVFANFDAREATANISRRFLTEVQEQKIPMFQPEGLGFGCLMAAAVTDGPFLTEFATKNFHAEMKVGRIFFGSMGSGQMLADPFLAFVCRVLWGNEMPTVEDGKFGVFWVLEHTIKHAPGHVGYPISLATLTQVDGRWVAKEENTQEAAQYVETLEEYIGRFEGTQPPIEEETAEPIPAPENN
jgi:hypothetical protein